MKMTVYYIALSLLAAGSLHSVFGYACPSVSLTACSVWKFDLCLRVQTMIHCLHCNKEISLFAYHSD